MLSRFSRVRLCVTPGSSVHGISQARLLEWVAVPSFGDLPDPGMEPASLVSPASAGGFFTTSTTWETHTRYLGVVKFTETESNMVVARHWGNQGWVVSV